MKAGHIITAACAAILLTGCGRVDAPLEKKSVASTTTTSFTFFTTSAEGEIEGDDSGTVTGADGKTTTKKKAVTGDLVSTTLTTTTTTEPTTTTTTTTTTAAPTTTTPAATSASETTPTETTPTESTTTFFDPNKQIINTFDLTEIRTVAYNGIEFTVGDRMSDIEAGLGDPTLPPMTVVSNVTGGSAEEYHYKMLTIVVESDMITSIEMERTEVNPELEPYITWGLRFGQPIGDIISFLGNAYQLTDPQTLLYSDGQVKLLFYAPNDVVERITVRL